MTFNSNEEFIQFLKTHNPFHLDNATTDQHTEEIKHSVQQDFELCKQNYNIFFNGQDALQNVINTFELKPKSHRKSSSSNFSIVDEHIRYTLNNINGKDMNIEDNRFDVLRYITNLTLVISADIYPIPSHYLYCKTLFPDYVINKQQNMLFNDSGVQISKFLQERLQKNDIELIDKVERLDKQYVGLYLTSLQRIGWQFVFALLKLRTSYGIISGDYKTSVDINIETLTFHFEKDRKLLEKELGKKDQTALVAIILNALKKCDNIHLIAIIIIFGEKKLNLFGKSQELIDQLGNQANTISKLESDVATMERDFSSKLQEERATNKRLNEELTQLKTQHAKTIHDLNEEYKQSQNRLTENQKELEKLVRKRHIISKWQQIMLETQQLTKMRLLKTEHEQKIHKLEKAQEQLTAEHARNIAGMRTLHEAELEETNQALKQQLKLEYQGNLQASEQQYTESVKHMKNQLETQKSEYAQKEQELRASITKSKQKIANLESAKLDLNTELSKKNKEIEEAEERKTSLRKEIEDLTSGNDALTQSLEEAQLKNVQLNSQIRELVKDVHEGKKELLRLQGQIDQLKKDHAQEIVDLKQRQWQALEIQRGRYDKELQTIRSEFDEEIDKHKSDYNDAKERYSQKLNDKITKKDAEYTERLEEFKRKQSEQLERLRSNHSEQLAERQSNYEELLKVQRETHLALQQDTMNAHRQKVSELDQCVLAKDVIIEGLQQSLARLRSDLDQLHQDRIAEQEQVKSRIDEILSVNSYCLDSSIFGLHLALKSLQDLLREKVKKLEEAEKRAEDAEQSAWNRREINDALHAKIENPIELLRKRFNEKDVEWKELWKALKVVLHGIRLKVKRTNAPAYTHLPIGHGILFVATILGYSLSRR
jgi:hypothetical protein